MRISLLWACFALILCVETKLMDVTDEISYFPDPSVYDGAGALQHLKREPADHDEVTEEESEEYEEATEKPAGTNDEGEDFALFSSCEQWATDYPNCNPENNMYLSPVNIDTKMAITTKDQTLFVFSDTPPKSLYNLEYSHKDLRGVKDTPKVDVLSINNGKDISKLIQATFVSGLGDSDYRYFRNALFLFTDGDRNLSPKRSFHQIDGQKFDMEIVLTFMTKPQDQFSDITQIHVMVKV